MSIPNLQSLCFEVINYFGKAFWMLQRFLFALFVVGGATQFIIWIISDNLTFNEALFKTLILFEWWIIVAFVIMALFALLRTIFDLDMRIYYGIWISKIAPFLYRRSNETYCQYISDIKDSKQYSSDGKTPTFVRREHLMRKSFWPYWSFSIVTIFNPQKVKQLTIDNNGKTNWILDVDLRDESYGIYSNAGKEYLRHRYSEAVVTEQMHKQSSEFYAFMNPKNGPGKSCVWGEVGEAIPLRWASGGFLPIVNYKGKKWAQLFVRDIFPVGLNVANGASETKDEYKNMHRLIGREFSEETILLSARPRAQGEVLQSTFVTFTVDPNANSPVAPFINLKFAKRQNRLRFEHDRIRLTRKPGIERKIFPLETPFKLQVTYHNPDLKSSGKQEIENVIYSVNPTEFGIEVVWLCNYDLRDGEYLLDGEYHLGRDVLIRRPIILLDMEFLREIYEKTGELGKLLHNDESRGCKLIPPITRESCEVFDIDVELRRSRVSTLKNELTNAKLPASRKSIIRWEIDRITKWFEMYEKDFPLISTSGIENNRLRTLCPVTWKTLEMIFLHKIKYDREAASF
jgi:hypothetical protein